MLNVTEMRGTIVSGLLTNEELDTLGAAVAFARSQLARKNTGSFIKGSNVKFKSNRTGQTYIGVVEKVGIKNIVVRTATSVYRVPANMLERV